jgi:hypothetical protein
VIPDGDIAAKAGKDLFLDEKIRIRSGICEGCGTLGVSEENEPAGRR